MNTPIYDFVQTYAASKSARFHMPGHKGKPVLGCEPYDITEIHGADTLYSATGIIAQSEQNATTLFETAHTFYSAEGSTLCIKAMLSLACASAASKQERPLILAGRNAHKAFVYACALLDLQVHWMYPDKEEHLCSCTITARDLEQELQSTSTLPAAVYVTSPDYLGHITDMKALGEVCARYNVPLLVDNAHGAYLHFLQPSLHPIRLGATMCCDSAHKTLPVLTGGAYLHIAHGKGEQYLPSARNALSLFASTSPSYLILQSLDLCNQYLSNDYASRLQACVNKIQALKQHLSSYGWSIESTEPLKLTIRATQSGYTGNELAALLRQNLIESEFSDDEYLVLMITPETDDEELARLRQALCCLPQKAPLLSAKPLAYHRAEAALSIREATLSPRELLPIENAQGRICSSPTVSCPPAVPIVISGERISEDTVHLLRRYGISQIEVVR